MRWKTKLPEIQPVVMAIVLDKDKRRERVVVGEKRAVTQLLEGYSDQQVLYDEERPLGTLMYDHEAQLRNEWTENAVYPLMCAMKSKRGRTENELKALEYLKAGLNSENPVTIFTAQNLMALYCLGEWKTPVAENVLEARMIALIQSYTGNVMNTWQPNVIQGWVDNTRDQLLRTSTNIDLGTMHWHPWTGCRQHCVVANETILPQLHVYVKQLLDWGCILQTCNVCGKPFAAFSGHYALCGMDECKVIQNRRNRAAYGVRAKENQYDQSYTNTRDYVQKKISKLKKRKDVPQTVIGQAEEWYANFRAEAKARKKLLSRNKDEIKIFCDWLFAQQRLFDELFGAAKP